MNSIRWKLLRAALFIIAALSLTSIGFFIMHLVIVNNYKSVSDNMIAEYRLIEATSNLINAYNNRFRSGDQESEDQVTKINKQITDLMQVLDSTIVNKESIVSYNGLKNTIKSVQDEINQGLDVLHTNKVVNATQYYDGANRKFKFVEENGAQLILTELKYSNAIQDRINKLYQISIIAAVAFFIIVVYSCVLFIVSFSSRLTRPIQHLTKIAEQVAEGNMNVKVGEDLLKQTDEIGSLSRSYNIMISRLLETISKLTQSFQSQTDTNKELERMNNLMVGREIKMVELKKEIENLTKKLHEMQPDYHGPLDTKLPS